MEKNFRQRLHTIPDEWKKTLRRLWWLMLLIPPFVLPALAKGNPWAVESVYSRAIFPVLNSVLNSVFGLLPFSVAELLLYVLTVLVPVTLTVLVVKLARKRMSAARFCRCLLSYLVAGCVVFNLFYLCWGLSYYRPTLASLLPLDVKERSVEELEAVCYMLAGEANALRDIVDEDENGVFRLGGSVRESFQKIPGIYQALGGEYPTFHRRVAPPKPVMASEGMSVMGISGIYFPFTSEANVNVHQPPLLLPASAAHEAAHALGIARENEANFIAYLACTKASDPETQYSGTMLALIHCGNALSGANREKYAALFATYSEGILRDIAAHGAYWRSYEGPVQENMDRLNDSYLRFNDQESGIKSYGEMVDLVLGYRLGIRN